MELGNALGGSSPDFSGGAGGKGMTGTVNLQPHGGYPAVDLTDRVHLLPCSIKHDGPCPVSRYFKPKRTDLVVDDLCIEEAFFRGRKLQGVTVQLPKGYRGQLEEGVGQWISRAEFGNLTYWNHDSFPSPDDPLCDASIGSLLLMLCTSQSPRKKRIPQCLKAEMIEFTYQEERFFPAKARKE